ncbi:MAG: hypothetical protein OXC18_17800 [Desulfurellaceae bacterium]|nr:hypothetical protein [Desulfurellaceae bacterium]
MATLAFDTHKAVKLLREAGADEPLAEAVVATVGDAMGENVATKVDIATVQRDIASLRAELKTDIAELEARLYRQLWLMAAGIVGLTVSLTVALVKLTA